MTTKIERTFNTTIIQDQYGYETKVGRYFIGISVFEMPLFKEYVVYVGATGINVGRLSITDFTIEFLDPITSENVMQSYDNELFEEIYNVAFDQFYKMIEEERQVI